MRDYAAIAARVKAQADTQRANLNETKQNARANLETMKAQSAGIQAQAQEIKQMRELAFIPSFFPTPRALCEQMAAWANTTPGATVLEPSAGKGNLAEAARHCGATVFCVEHNYTLAQLLKQKGFETAQDDFMQWQPKQGQVFDIVLMNPPFENGQDIDHVQRAYEFVKTGGALVAIMSAGAFFRSDKKATAFRAWLDNLNSTYKQLPADTFGKSEHPTNVQTYCVTINK